MIKEIKKELSRFLKGLKFDSEVLQTEQVKISERVVGGKVELIDGDGNLNPIPDGQYKVDEFEFVAKDGIIESIIGEEKPAEEVKEEFEEITSLQIGDEVTISPEAKEYMPWYDGVGFVVNSIDGHGEGMVGLANSKGFYVTYVKADSVTKTGNKVELPKEENFAESEPESNDEKSALEELKSETESIKSEIAAIKEIIAQLAGKSEVEDFKSEVVELNKTLQAIASTPAQFSKTSNNPISKEKADNTASILSNIMRKK